MSDQQLKELVGGVDVSDCSRVDVSALMQRGHRRSQFERVGVVAVALLMVVAFGGTLWAMRPGKTASPAATSPTPSHSSMSAIPGHPPYTPPAPLKVAAGSSVDLAGTGATLQLGYGTACLTGLIPPETLVAVRCASVSELSSTTAVVDRSAAYGATAVFFGVTKCGPQAVDYYLSDSISQLRVAGQIYEVSSGSDKFCAYSVETPSSEGSPPPGRLAFSAANETPATPLPIAFVTVPDVVGLTLEEARKRLNAVGLNRLRTTPTPDVLNSAVVVAQSPSPGSKMAPMNEVVLTVAPITIGTGG